jgi:pimeloyl-ACP methyl ester carboxylesterase
VCQFQLTRLPAGASVQSEGVPEVECCGQSKPLQETRMSVETLPAKSALRAACSAALLACLLSGCALLGVAEQQKLDRQLIRLTGTVNTAEPLEGNLVVVMLRKSAGADEDEILGHYVVERSGGRFLFVATEPGEYRLAAFNDRDADLVYEGHEPVLISSSSTTFSMGKGQTESGIELFVPPSARADPGRPIAIRDFESRSAQDQLALTLNQVESVGEVADLSDPRFAAEVAPKGMWAPYDFVFEIGAGVFFLEAYDDDRIPVLFIHGISGFPAQFRELIDSLDKKRFQPWVYLYPSGAKLDNIARHLTQVLQRLESRYEFRDIAFVAHSMGGLVTRAFLLDYYQQTGRDYDRKLITISTPWGGMASAAGATRLRHPVYSWIDITPNSDFLNRIFYEDAQTKDRQLLPPGLTSHMLFGFAETEPESGGGFLLEGFRRMARDKSSDGTVPVVSQLRPEAQHDASSVFGVDATHTGILKDPLTIERVNHLLGNYADEL